MFKTKPCILYPASYATDNVAKQFTIERFLLDFQTDPTSLPEKAGKKLLKSTILMGNPDLYRCDNRTRFLRYNMENEKNKREGNFSQIRKCLVYLRSPNQIPAYLAFSPNPAYTPSLITKTHALSPLLLPTRQLVMPSSLLILKGTLHLMI